MVDQSTLDISLHRAHALLGAREQWPNERSLNGRLQIGDLRVLVHAVERLRRIERYPGEQCESSTEASPCGPVEYHDAEGVPLCADCYDALQAEWESLPICPDCRGSDEDCLTCAGLGRIMGAIDDTDDACPVGDPDCLGRDGDCHDACTTADAAAAPCTPEVG